MGSSCTLARNSVNTNNFAKSPLELPDFFSTREIREKNLEKRSRRNIQIVPSKSKGIRETPTLKPLGENQLFKQRITSQVLSRFNDNSFTSQTKTRMPSFIIDMKINV